MLTAAMFLLKQQELAKDAAQDAFIGLWNNRKTLDPNKSVRAYLKTATVSKALNIIKSRKHHMGESTDTLITMQDQEMNPHEIQEHQELKSQIQQAIDCLPERCGNIFRLAKFEGMSQKQIAEQLGISRKTVENQMGIALKKLRQHLDPILKHKHIIILFFIGLEGLFILGCNSFV